jgi:methanol--5-hydroxybenzimidazolylcobamide Co-methyltransferase
MKEYSSLAIDDERELVFGAAPNPVQTRSGMVIGGGEVYPEINFTLPPMNIDESTMPQIREQYKGIIEGATTRAAELEVPGLVVEFETLPPMCQTPAWAEEIAQILLDGMADAEQKWGLKSAFRMTPNDLREMSRPPRMRDGEFYEQMMETFERTAAAGAEFLSIESTGGKEISDDALTMCDLPATIFAQCVLGVRDMRLLWTELGKIADRHGVKIAGDSACGFANTAMVLAERHYIPRVFAAVVRAVSAVRSLVAYECGAVGPGKDCGYENVFIKPITGAPMAMEGKTSACAHFSPIGNIASAMADTWSNESVQNIKLLAGMAPTCYVEQLSYDCRLMNAASAQGSEAAVSLRNLMVDSDARLDPQAWVLRPDVALKVAHAIVDAPDHYRAGVAAAATAIESLRSAHEAGALAIDERELTWLDTMEGAVEDLPDAESDFIDDMLAQVDTDKFHLEDYGL